MFGKALTPEDFPDIILGLAQHLLPEDSQDRSRFLTLAKSHLKAFNTLVTAIISEKEEVERERQRAAALI